jgi:hypothetical protein
MLHVEVDPNTNNPADEEEHRKKLLQKNNIRIIIMDGADIQVILDMAVCVFVCLFVCLCPCMYLFVSQCVGDIDAIFILSFGFLVFYWYVSLMAHGSSAVSVLVAGGLEKFCHTTTVQ